MQDTSALYKQIYSSRNYKVETVLAIGNQTPQTAYTEEDIISLSTSKRVFQNNYPEVGCCICGEIDISMYMPSEDIPRQAMLVPWVRLVSTEDGSYSEWLKKGVYFIDTRQNTKNRDNMAVLTIHGMDAMIKTEQLYPSTTLEFPTTPLQLADDIASKIGTVVDSRCRQHLNKNYEVPYPSNYTMREALSQIGLAIGGNWIMNDIGELQFIPLWELPKETNLLIDNVGYRIVFGVDPNDARILV